MMTVIVFCDVTPCSLIGRYGRCWRPAPSSTLNCGCGMDRAIKRWSLTSEVRARCQYKQCGTCGKQNGTGTSSSPSPSISLCYYLSTDAPYSFIYHRNYIKLANDGIVKDKMRTNKSVQLLLSSSYKHRFRSLSEGFPQHKVCLFSSAVAKNIALVRFHKYSHCICLKSFLWNHAKLFCM